MFAKTTKSSSTWDSSRKLYRLSRTVSSVNWSEHWLLFNPRRHPHPSYMNFCTLVMILSLFSVWLQSISTLVDSSILQLWYKPSYKNNKKLVIYFTLSFSFALHCIARFKNFGCELLYRAAPRRTDWIQWVNIPWMRQTAESFESSELFHTVIEPS